MIRKYLVAITAVLIVAGVLVGIKVSQIRTMMAAGAHFTMPPETVGSTVAKRVDWETAETAVGTVTAVQGVLLKSEVPGLVKSITFESGASAREGQVLVELDRSTEEAQLRSAEARTVLARANLARARDLSRQDILPKSDLDAKEAAFAEMTSEADGIRVAIAKKVIRAPFTGRLGIRQVQLGQFANVGTPIVGLQSLDPVHVDFTLPEQEAGRLRRGMKLRVTSDAAPGRTFEGELTAISPEVDGMSRNLELQGTLTSTDGVLLPGMFARVEVLVEEHTAPLVIPVTSVLKAPYGDSVFVLADVKDPKTGQASKQAQMTTVKLGETRGDLVVVESGLKEGQEIAASGVFKLTNGSAVVVNNELTQPAEATPHPTES